MTTKEQAEHRRLLAKWAKRKATAAEIARCMVLDRKNDRERREARQVTP